VTDRHFLRPERGLTGAGPGRACRRSGGRAVIEEEKDSDAALLLEGIVLRLQADLRWLHACEIAWTKRSTPK
jgi:hypothetical protein